MKNEIKNVRLSLLCHENWETFSVKDNEKFCEKCHRKVHDFTGSSGDEFKKVVQASPHACGRFKSSQLNLDFLRYAVASMLAISTIASCTSEPVNKAPGPPVGEMESEREQQLMGMILLPELDSGELSGNKERYDPDSYFFDKEDSKEEF